jgi:nicotinate-nucleotide--dimethylbenzimidazole phosphoribosyltransferase
MSEPDCVRAIAYGMMAVEPGLDVLALGEMGIANTTSAAALCFGLFGGAAEEWTGAGTGVQGPALEAKRQVVAEAVERHKPAAGDPLAWLAAVGGLELSAIVGAILAARLARTPILLDGFVCTAAAAVLWKLDPRLLDHCRVGHLSSESGHQRLCGLIGQTPLLQLGMRLGEGSGATLAIGLLRAAVACHEGMASFTAAGVSGPV